MSDILDRPLEPNRRYACSVVLLERQIEASKGELLPLIVEHTIAKLLGPHAERVKMPIDEKAVVLTLTAQIEPWSL